MTEAADMADDGKAGRETTEVRFHAPTEYVSVIDAVAFATVGDRSKVMNQLVKEFVEKEVHRSTLILRVARVNPLAKEPDGKDAGK